MLIIALVGFLKAAVDAGVIFIVGLVIDSLHGTWSSTLARLVTQNQLLIIAAILFIIRPIASLCPCLLCDQCLRARFSPMVRWKFYNKVNNIIGLLMRFYDPSGGRILLGDTNIQQLSLNDLRRQFSILTQ